MTSCEHTTIGRVVAICLLMCSAASGEAHSPGSVFLQEGFDGSGLPNGWTVSPVVGASATWTIVGTGTNPPVDPYAGAGQAKFNSYDAAVGHQSRLTSRRVSLTGSTDPFLTFFLYHDDEFLSSPDSVYIDASTADSITGPWTTLAGFRRPNSVTGWRGERVSLLQFSGSSRLFLAFRGVSQYGNNLYIDEVRVADSSFHDIGLAGPIQPGSMSEALSTPENKPRGTTGKTAQFSTDMVAAPAVYPLHSPFDLSAIVQNYGTFAESSYQIRWTIDGLLQTPVNNTRPLQRNGRDTLTLSWPAPSAGTHAITAWTMLGGDSNGLNDTIRATVILLDTNAIYAEMFNGSFPPPGWIAINRDGGTLPPWFQGSAASTFPPFEGTGFAADNFQRANGTYIDDYLISPAIAGIAPSSRSDSITFWVRSAFNPPPAANFPDSLMVMLSTSGSDTSDFSIILDYFSVPKTGWIQKSYPLSGVVPANATIRVAFRYLHFNGGPSGANSDFIGVDAVTVVRGLPTSVRDGAISPSSYKLYQNTPNPFNPATSIRIDIAIASNVTLTIYNVLGQEVTTLIEDWRNAGTYQVVWDGRNSTGVQVGSGVYLYRLTASSPNNATAFTSLRKMVLLK